MSSSNEKKFAIRAALAPTFLSDSPDQTWSFDTMDSKVPIDFSIKPESVPMQYRCPGLIVNGECKSRKCWLGTWIEGGHLHKGMGNFAMPAEPGVIQWELHDETQMAKGTILQRIMKNGENLCDVSWEDANRATAEKEAAKGTSSDTK